MTGVGVFEAGRLLLVTGLADAGSGRGTNTPGLCSLVVSGGSRVLEVMSPIQLFVLR